MKHSDKVEVLDEGGRGRFFTRRNSSAISFDEELDRLLRESAKSDDAQLAATPPRGPAASVEEMIRRAEFNPA